MLSRPIAPQRGERRIADPLRVFGKPGVSGPQGALALAKALGECGFLPGVLGGEQAAPDPKRKELVFPGPFAEERLALGALSLGECTLGLFALGFRGLPGGVVRLVVPVPLGEVFVPARRLLVVRLLLGRGLVGTEPRLELAQRGGARHRARLHRHRLVLAGNDERAAALLHVAKPVLGERAVQRPPAPCRLDERLRFARVGRVRPGALRRLPRRGLIG